MARVIIEMPEQYIFSTELPVRIEHINQGNHVGNHQLIMFLNEARIQFMPELIDQPEYAGCGMINADIAVIYKSETVYPEVLQIKIAVDAFHKYGFDIFFHVTEKQSGREVAHAKMGMMMFDFAKGNLRRIDDDIRNFFKINLL